MLSSLISLVSAHMKMEAHAPVGRVLITGLFVLLLTFYIWLRLTRGTSFNKGLKIGIAAFVFLSIFTFPLLFFVLARSSETMDPSVFVYRITSMMLGFGASLALVIVFADIFQDIYKLLRLILRGIAKLIRRPLPKKEISVESKIRFKTYRSICLISIAFLYFIIGYLQAVSNPGLEIRKVDFTNGSSSAKSIRIAHLSDLHINPVLNGPWLTEIIAKIKSTEPDLVVITGDFADGKARFNKKYLKLFNQLKAPVYFVSGNHEFLWGKDSWIAAFDEAGISVLDGRRVILDLKGMKVLLAGIPDSGGGPWKFAPPAQFNDLLKDAPASDVKILLSHRPEIMPFAAKAGYNLVLAGHTHNGQIFPFNVFAGLVTPYPVGIYKDGRTVLFTSPGAGYVGPPLRTFVPKEITILDISIH